MKRKPNNPRQISKREFERLAADLERFGDLGGVVHNETTGNFVGGNQRSSVFELERQGAQITVTETYAEPTRTGTVARGYVEWRGERYDYRRVRWDTETEDAACLVANLRGGSWDFDALSAWDGDLLHGIGFDGDLLAAWNDQAANLRELLESEKPAPVEDAGAQVDKAEELREKWGVESGQLWQLGEHRLICGDCTDKAVVARVMGGEKADMVIADPPYGVNIVATNGYVGGGETSEGMIPFGGGKRRNGHYAIEERGAERLGSIGGAKPFGSRKVRGADGAAHLVDVGKYMPIAGDDTTETAVKSVKFYLNLFPEAMQFWFGANYYIDALTPSPCWVVWDKETTGNFADCELAWSNINRSAKLFRHRWNGMLRDSEHGRRFHPTQKPAALAAFIMSEFGKQEQIVIDPFGGAGWVLIGADSFGMKARIIEIVPEYCAVAIERWVQTTGGTPVLVNSTNG